MSDKKEPVLVEVTLAKAHTHADVDYAVGAKIKVSEPVRDWLAANQVITTAAPKEGAK